MEVDHRGETTPYGGLAAAHLLAKKVGLDRAIYEHLHLLRFHLPYHESDHCLTHAYNLFVGGTAIEDIENLQESPAVRNLLGAERVPDPSTAGDFLRRFGPADLAGLQSAIDTARVARLVLEAAERGFPEPEPAALDGLGLEPIFEA